MKQRSGEVALKAISYRWRSTLVLGLVVAGFRKVRPAADDVRP